jgi:DNA-binding NarL/FixJ family response regulator
MPKITVGIVEDNLLLAKTITDKLALSEDLEVVIKATNGQDLLNQLENNNIPDVILMDIEMDIMDGITATYRVKSKFPSIKILMLSVYDDDQKLFEAIQAGASGYLLKDEKTSKLINAISEVFEGGASLSPSMATKALNLLRKPTEQNINADIECLSLREKEVLECLTEGKTIKQIADKLFVAEKTIKKHLEHIYQKLQVNSSREAMAKVMKNH